MLLNIIPKLPMRNKMLTKDFYLNNLGFQLFGDTDFDSYLMIFKDNIEIHFFEFKDLIPTENDGQVYIRTQNIETFYQSLLNNNVPIHPNGALENKPWGQKEFSLLDPDNNLLTFGESIMNQV